MRFPLALKLFYFAKYLQLFYGNKGGVFKDTAHYVDLGCRKPPRSGL